MEFNLRLQELRKERGITQKELADRLFVSRTAVSKWESGRGYPGIDSLKAIAAYFDVSLDSLLSSDEALDAAKEDEKRKERRLSALIFGFLDISAVLFFFMPLFRAQGDGGEMISVSLVYLMTSSQIISVLASVLLGLTISLGTFILAFQSDIPTLWERIKRKISVGASMVLSLLFALSLHPYAASLALLFLAIKLLVTVRAR